MRRSIGVLILGYILAFIGVGDDFQSKVVFGFEEQLSRRFHKNRSSPLHPNHHASVPNVYSITGYFNTYAGKVLR